MPHRTANDPAARRPADGLQQVETPPPAVIQARRRLRWLNRLSRWLPDLLVMGLLVGLGAYGHHSGWTLPKLSALAGHAATGDDDWCAEHAVPESQCVECHPELLPPGKDFGWCAEHGVHDCPLEHPEVAELRQTPAVAGADRQRIERAMASAPRPANNPRCQNYRRRIQFASGEAMEKAGVDCVRVERRKVCESISASGQITYDQTRVANLSARLPGTVWRVEKNVGDRVRAGEVVVLVEAAEVGRLKSELIQALAEEEIQAKSLDKLLPAYAERVVLELQVEKARLEHVQAQARLLCAQQALVNLGLPVGIEALRGLAVEKLVERLRLLGIPQSPARPLNAGDLTANLLPVKAPIEGIIVSGRAVAGDVVDPARALFQLADTSRMWLTLNVSLEDAGRLAPGQAVCFRPDGSPAELRGKLVWIGAAADLQTRTVAVRAELPNAEGQLRNGTFGAGRITLREEGQAIVVPNEAVHWEGCCHVVFVRDKGFDDRQASPKVFHVRTVRLGARSQDCTEILAGVLPDEIVAAKGSDVLRAELLKNNLGEPCGCAK
ncbi:MAG: efflux RND transporter periplasmic adaptor subunit [Thermoguttaceae bacterium]|jgi:multidrug efflux pump subunit AcrA (membrane-fusion protein)